MLTIWKQPCDEGQIRAGVAVSPCTRSPEPWVLAATILGSSLVFIDGTVVNVALPILQSELQATVIEVQWVFEAYALLFAALLLVGGSLGDRLGRRAIFAVGVTVFAAASAACGLAVDARGLIAARAIQGVGAALMAPASLAIIGSAFPEERRGWAIGVWSSLSAISSALGPVAGGWLIENASWRLVFFVNLPIALAVLGATFWRVPESRDEAAGRLDWWGALLGTVGLGGVVYGLIESSNFGLAHPLVPSALRRGHSVTGVIHSGRGSQPNADDAARNVPVAYFCWGQPAHLSAVRQPQRVPLFLAIQPHPGTVLLDDGGRGRTAAVRPGHICVVEVVRRPGRPLRRSCRWSPGRSSSPARPRCTRSPASGAATGPPSSQR